MGKEEFLTKLAEILDTKTQLSEETFLWDVPEFDSMSAMGFIAFADEHFSKKLKATDIHNLNTVRDFMDLVGMP